MKRRDFLRFMGMLSGSAVLASCGSRKRPGRFVSYILPPDEGALPGEATFHPSTCTECPAGCGLLVRVRDGWPVKLEGAPGHPVSDGGLCIRGQASLTRLYHPERIRNPVLRTGEGKYRDISWEDALSLVADALAESRAAGRKSFYLAGRTTGALSGLIDAFCRSAGLERAPEFEVYGHSALKEACSLLFGERDVPLYRIEDADFLLTVGADILETFVSPVSFTRMLSRAKDREDFRWVHVEPHFSLTGANADRRLAVPPGAEPHLLAHLLREVSTRGGRGRRLPREVVDALPRLSAEQVAERTGIAADEIREIASRLARAKRPLVVAGGVSTAHAAGLDTAVLAGLVQWATDGIPDLVDFSRAENYRTVGTFRDMEKLSAILEKGEAGVLFFSRCNPLFALPKESPLRGDLLKARLSVGLGDLPDETLRAVNLVLPLSHSLESWDAVEPRRGVASLVQPVREPLHDTLSEGDLLLAVMSRIAGKEPPKNYRDHVAAFARERYGKDGWETLQETGHLARPAPRKGASLNAAAAAAALRAMRPDREAAGPVLVLAPSLRTFDGRSRGLPHLSEIPDPLTTVSYGRWLSVSPGDAARSGLKELDEAAVSGPGLSEAMPVKLQPGLPEGVFVLHRDFLDAPPVATDGRTGGPVEYLPGVALAATGRRARLPVLSGSPSQHGRGLIPDPSHRDETHRHERVSLYPEHDHKEYRWTMAIDLDRCNGCSACVAACYIENNVPVVGAKDHLRGREMSWLRIEPFYGENGQVDFLPMLCQQCHYAPCETVCPVFAAYHNPEGLNVQVYARCVGTRYCSNNCPYKVRRFNWWEHRPEEPMGRMQNPDVPARTVGVMEKCTFCVQRIRQAKDRAKDESRAVRDGEFTTACAQSCPAGAIVFGNLLDPESKVYRLAHSARAYRVFEILGTEPSVHYLHGRKPGQGA